MPFNRGGTDAEVECKGGREGASTGLISCGGGTGMTGRRGNDETTDGGGTPGR